MTITAEQVTRAQSALDVWRAQSTEAKQAARQSVLIDRVAASMAMENEPVSELWIHQTKTAQA